MVLDKSLFQLPNKSEKLIFLTETGKTVLTNKMTSSLEQKHPQRYFWMYLKEI